MSKYTVELRNIIESEKKYPRPTGVLTFDSILKSYPLFGESYTDSTTGQTINRRNELNQKIIDRFYMREINYETVDLWLMKFNHYLNVKMKYFNQLYKSVDLEYNPLWNVDLTETFTRDLKGTGKTTSKNTDNTSGDNLNVNQDTPNQEITEDDIKSNKWASNTAYDKSSSLTINDGEINSDDSKNETYTRKQFGSSAGYTFPQNLQQWRNVMINVDEQVLDSLEDMFIKIW